jgi:hypothetical protein
MKPVGMKIVSGGIVLCSALAAGLSFAGPAAVADSPKYQIMKADNERVWRLDTETGEIAVCQMENARMVCASSGGSIDKSKATADDLEKARERERTAAREDKFATMDRLMMLFERFMKMVSELKLGASDAMR